MKSKTPADKTTILIVTMLVAGLCLLLYPQASNHCSRRHATQEIASYADDVSQLDGEMFDEMRAAADEFNHTLAARTDGFSLTDDQREHYRELLNITDGGVMGYIEIPAIDVRLPIYHGVDEAALQTGVGHLEWSSLPVGGADTHCVLSGHRGLPSAKLFTNLDKLAPGDTFLLRVLNDTLTYQVDRVLVVQPNDTSALQIVDGDDLCTLVTCTPYGINTERLLVRGHRVDNTNAAPRLTADAIRIEPLVVAPLLAAPLLLAMLVALLLPHRTKYKLKAGKGDDYEVNQMPANRNYRTAADHRAVPNRTGRGGH